MSGGVFTPSDPTAIMLCTQIGGSVFYPPEDSEGRGNHSRDAKKVCMSCEVRTECLDWALTTGETFGVWGGKTESERKGLRSRMEIRGELAPIEDPDDDPGDGEPGDGEEAA